MTSKIVARNANIAAGLTVHRILPERRKRLLGPFCFLDHMGPAIAQPDQDTDVRAHPHIGLSTLTYLFNGRMVHRDSLDNKVLISPGDVNWMTARNGIAHSERTHPDDKSVARMLEGLQFWVALPDGQEDIAPSFQHYAAADIPTNDTVNATITVVAGSAFGLTSPVVTTSPLVLAIIDAKQDFALNFSYPGFELGLYVAHGQASHADESLVTNELLVFDDSNIDAVTVQAGSRLVLFGGQPLASPRLIWWNLVASSNDRIEAAKLAWKSGTFPMVPGESDFIPLPER